MRVKRWAAIAREKIENAAHAAMAPGFFRYCWRRLRLTKWTWAAVVVGAAFFLGHQIGVMGRRDCIRSDVFEQFLISDAGLRSKDAARSHSARVARENLIGLVHDPAVKELWQQDLKRLRASENGSLDAATLWTDVLAPKLAALCS